jgi:hypothetical protein
MVGLLWWPLLSSVVRMLSPLLEEATTSTRAATPHWYSDVLYSLSHHTLLPPGRGKIGDTKGAGGRRRALGRPTGGWGVVIQVKRHGGAPRGEVRE